MNPIKIDVITIAGMDFPIKPIEMMPDDMLLLINTNPTTKERNVVMLKGIDIIRKAQPVFIYIPGMGIGCRICGRPQGGTGGCNLCRDL